MSTIRRAFREGIEFGACAGFIWLLADVVINVVQRRQVFAFLRQLAAARMPEVSTSAVLLLGVFAYLAIGAVLGVVYCLMNACFTDRTRTRWDRQAAFGLLFGAAVCGVKMYIVTRHVYPTLLMDRSYQFAQLLLHTFFFGVPLAIFYTSAERQLQPLVRAIETAATPGGSSFRITRAA